ncbi:ACS family D-galactonate transporter-like MFS transporter [Arthrobacter sp. B2I5]|uniref:MFS transporter n=1 Tax=Arthrobacter sp. B2I5 TaxID=3042266 RepID=UPI00277F8668|nr:MFS transporter [Arthrobacter sp. B2I5]MDQ0826209.1 ACS family D-galactonate transporter-like MFS transporter [Arthrobacter sp. B2I5]
MSETPLTGVVPATAASRDPRTWSRAKRNRYGWFITFSVLFLMMLSWADKAVLGIAAVPIMKQLGITPEQFGLVGSAMFLTFGVAQIVAAPIANKISSKWILLVLCLLWSVAQVPILLFASLPALWASRLLLGAGEGPLAPVLMHGIYKWFPEKKGATPAALASSGVTLGIVAFAPVLAWVIGQFGWQTAFALLAIVGLVWSIFWLIAGKEGPYTSRKAEQEIDGTGSEEAPAVTETKVRYWRTILSPSWIFAVLASFFGYWTFTLAMSWGPAYFQNVLGFTGQQSGAMIALPAAWGTIATVGLSALTQRLHLKGVPTRKARGWVLGSAGTFAGACLVAATLTTSPVLSIALMVFGFGTAPALFAITYLVVAELTTIAQRGANLSIANAVLTTGGVFAPAVSGFLIGGAATPAEGYRAAFALAGALLLTFGVLALVFVNQQRDRRSLGLDVAHDGAPAASTLDASTTPSGLEVTPAQASTKA